MASTVPLEPVSAAGLNSLILKTDTRGHVRTPAARREALLAEFDRSGLSGRQFASLTGLNYSTFAYWRHLRKRRSGPPNSETISPKPQVAWLEAVVQQGMPSGSTGLILQLPGGVRAEIASQQQVHLAAALLRALEKPC